MSETPVRIGVVGLGNIGMLHAEWLENSRGTLVGGVDVDSGARESFTREFGVESYGEIEPLLERSDAVVITTPNRFHEEHAVAALETGVDVLVEKPLAHTVASAERIAATARDSPAFCMVGFHTVFENPVEVMTAYREAGRFGDVHHVDAAYLRRRGVPGRSSWFTQAEVAGGGALVDIGAHAIDLSLHLLGFPEVEEVSGVTRAEFGNRDDYTYLDMWGADAGPEAVDVEDSASAFVRCRDGSTVSLEVAWAANRPAEQTYVLQGTEAGARLSRDEESLTLYETSDAGSPHMVDSDIETGDDDGHVAELAYFVDHVDRGEPPEINTIEEGLTVQRVIGAVYESDERGEAVSIPD
jgi:predicted dehydrogenase